MNLVRIVKPFNPEVQKKIIGDRLTICRPADLIAPQMPQFIKECAQWKQQDEDVLSYALFPTKGAGRVLSVQRSPAEESRCVADKENKCLSSVILDYPE